MLKLIGCELAKLKRKKFISFVILSAFLFPPPLAVMMLTPSMVARYDTKAQLFDDFYQFVLGYAVELLLPCVIAIIAAMLFFMERDNDTFKNLRTIPVTGTQMIFAKITVLFLFGLIFCLSSATVAILCGSLIAEVGGLGYKLWLAVKLGVFITAGTLPLVVLVVFFSRTYIFSTLLCIFYSVLSLTAEGCYEVMPKFLCWLMPIPLTNLWCAGDMIRHGARESVGRLQYLIPTTMQTVLILAVMSVLSVLLIDLLYKKRGGE
ncbi:ABC transporter permease [Anaerotruncus sp. 1XD42-93]|uniref:ABC transporter permease n=1 Tax=Anaerotruncus sp. 1XD42-93 TaxID=2320853 RepID=UPI000EA05A12|nr:ABC transporter permease [Anaerotruncus sp. 1XD42-93]NBK19558.1 ABC transporter permease [Anaerotruncus sp. 1XD42-93]RKJ78740.1 ABC transporter permease [Anaerotruncus sp. 1XD22-93]